MSHIPISPTSTVINAQSYGATGGGVVDDTAALQSAINAAVGGHILYIPKGKYLVSSTLQINTGFIRIIGDVCARAANGGTEIAYTGTGACFQGGTDNGHAWDASDYDGPQDIYFENIWIAHRAPDTTLALGFGQYKTGSYGIRDWRGGSYHLYNVGIEQFEYNFWGIQSDINEFRFITSLYSKNGLYFGPRSDQNVLAGLYTYYCDRAVVVDKDVRQLRIEDAQIVHCGNASQCSIEIYKGAASIRIARPWFEHLDGYSGTDGAGFIAVGLTNGYGGETRPAKKITVEDPLVYTSAMGAAYHMRCLVRLGAGYDVQVRNPASPVGVADSLNLDAFVLVPSGTSETAGTAFASCVGVDASLSLANLFKNEGAGTPGFTYIANFGPGPGTTLYVPSGYQMTVNGQLTVSDGIGLKTVAGAVSDGSFSYSPPPNGTIAIDTTNSKIYVRIGGAWKSVTVT